MARRLVEGSVGVFLSYLHSSTDADPPWNLILYRTQLCSIRRRKEEFPWESWRVLPGILRSYYLYSGNTSHFYKKLRILFSISFFLTPESGFQRPFG
jgi:hypothetical protein